ncbi:MAG TPA: preprotein translocase subunit YajC [Rhodanobacteraceae bacterium]|nr:preprotein translocase subunit YajC [Rhodanobacteraceae bacterium]
MLRTSATHGIIRCLLGRSAAARPPHNRESYMLPMLFAAAAAPAAPGAAQGAESLFSSPIILVYVVVIIGFYFLFIRPQSKRQKEHRKMISELAKGDEVVAAGILGRVENVGEHFLTLEIADNVQVRVQKGAVSTVLPKGTLKSS